MYEYRSGPSRLSAGSKKNRYHSRNKYKCCLFLLLVVVGAGVVVVFSFAGGGGSKVTLA